MDRDSTSGNPLGEPTGNEPKGTTLSGLLHQRTSLADRLTLLPQFAALCQAVGVAHGRGTVHRGLHPGSATVTEYGETSVPDWSLSKTRGREDVHAADLEAALDRLRTGATDVRIDPAYVAPEIALGHMDMVDARSDVYALGAILYEILTGKPPFAGKGLAEALASVASAKPASPCSLEPSAPAELVKICERAMHQEPSARYGSGRLLADDVLRFQAGPTPKAAPQTEPGSKYAPYLAAAAVAMLFLLGLAAFSQRRAVQERDDAVVARKVAEQRLQETEEARDRLAQELEAAQRARQDAEKEREVSDIALREAKDSLKRLQETQGKTAQALADAMKSRAIDRTEEPAQEPDAQAPATSPKPAPEPAARPPVLAAGFPAPIVMGTPKDGSQRPPGISKAELAKSLPELASSLKMESRGGGKEEIVVRPVSTTASDDLQRLGFKDGDIITNVNRTSVESVDQVRKALDGVKNDPGFTVRIVRDGASSWMRINVLESMPVIAPKPGEETAKTPPEPAKSEDRKTEEQKTETSDTEKPAEPPQAAEPPAEPPSEPSERPAPEQP